MKGLVTVLVAFIKVTGKVVYLHCTVPEDLVTKASIKMSDETRRYRRMNATLTAILLQ